MPDMVVACHPDQRPAAPQPPPGTHACRADSPSTRQHRNITHTRSCRDPVRKMTSPVASRWHLLKWRRRRCQTNSRETVLPSSRKQSLTSTTSSLSTYERSFAKPGPEPKILSSLIEASAVSALLGLGTGRHVFSTLTTNLGAASR